MINPVVEMPYNSEYEHTVLAGVILGAGTQLAIDALDFVQPHFFYIADCQHIYSIVLQNYNDGKPYDAPAISGQLNESHKRFLADLLKNSVLTPNLIWYSQKLKELSYERELINRLNLAINQMGADGTHQERIDNAMSLLSNIDDPTIDDSQYIADDLADYLDELERRFHSNGELIGLSTGFSELDSMIQGLRGGDLFVIAGRPAMGKTAIAINIAEHIALSGGHVKVFSMEMPRMQLIERIAASQGDINLKSLRTGRFDKDEWPKVNKAFVQANKMKINIDERGGLNVNQIKAAARKTHRRDKLDLIVLDYIQLMAGNKGHSNRVGEITEITRELKALAKELDIPLIAISQLSRKVEDRTDKRPMMSDLRESGSIEQDADQILMMYRDEYYNDDSPYKGLAEGILVKQRAGMTGTIHLESKLHYAKFCNLTRPWPDAPVKGNQKSFAKAY